MALAEGRALRILLAIGAGAFTWHLVLGASMGILRLLWPAYAAAYPERDYTLAMLWVRLVVFSVTVIVTSATAVLIGRDERLAWLVGLAILGFSIPPHFYPGSIWLEYPPWYHYTWLLLILPNALASVPIARRWRTLGPRAASA
jgi:hypothetical protein